MCLPVLDHILSVAGLVVALAVAQLIIVPVLMPAALTAGVGTAAQAALVFGDSALALPEGVPLSAALVAAVVVALSLHVLDHLACGGKRSDSSSSCN